MLEVYWVKGKSERPSQSGNMIERDREGDREGDKMNKTEIWGVRDLSKGTCVVGQLDVPGRGG